MPSKKSKTTRKRKKRQDTSSYSIVFFPLLVFVLIMWVTYRNLFSFPVWFDEIIGKAIFFGMPVWLYVVITNAVDIVDSFAFNKLRRGLLIGLAIGGLFGFAAALLGLSQKNTGVQAAQLFIADQFWWEFFLALMTAFWETLFFFSFVAVVVFNTFKNWDLLKQVLLIAFIFLLFHLPNIILRFSGVSILQQIFLLFLFAIGQSLIFVREKNAYPLVISHAIWGMVLLVHLG